MLKFTEKDHPLTFKHCLRFSWELLPGGAAADNKRGNTARIAAGYTPPTSPEIPEFRLTNPK